MTEPADTLPLARKIAALAEERRATDLVLLDVRGLVDYTDYFLLATGQSARQNQAIAEHVVKTLKGEKRYAISKAGLDTGRWICIDLTDVVFHVFDAETRARYDLELLWADAPRVDLATAAAPAAPEGAPAPEAPAPPPAPVAAPPAVASGPSASSHARRSPRCASSSSARSRASPSFTRQRTVPAGTPCRRAISVGSSPSA